MPAKKSIIAALVGWLIAFVFPPQALLAMFSRRTA